MMTTSRLLFTLLGLLFFSAAFPQDLLQRAARATGPAGNEPVLQPFRYVSTGRSANLQQAISLQLDQPVLDTFWRKPQATLRLQVPVSDQRSIYLQLDQSEPPTTVGYALRRGSGGEESTNSKMYFYRGRIADNEQSLATLTLFPDRMRILISDEAGNYVLGPRSGSKAEYVLYNDLELQRSAVCAVPEDWQESKGIYMGNRSRSAQSGLMPIVPIYLEADYALYQGLGAEIITVEEYVLALFHEVASVYAQAGINIELAGLKIWDVPDPYASSNSTREALYAFANEVQNNYPGRLAQLLSGLDLGGGVAWRDVLCQEYRVFEDTQTGERIPFGPYSVSANLLEDELEAIPDYSWPVQVVAHELGHNFGSRHTHACVWNGNNTQIDDCGNSYSGGEGVFDTDEDEDDLPDNGCFNPYEIPLPPRILPDDGGTIMSYCQSTYGVGVNLSKGFHPQVRTLMRERLAAAGCLQQETVPVQLQAILEIQGRVPPTGIEVELTLQRDFSNEQSTATVILPENGTFSLPELTSGLYTICSKSEQTLRRSRTVAVQPDTEQPVALGRLLSGDVNNDNAVTLSDFTILSGSFGAASGSSAYDARSDLNADGIISLSDFTILASNFSKVGAMK